MNQSKKITSLKKIKILTNLETLASAMHDNWSHWTKYMLANLTSENIERWKRQSETEYKDLPEDQKPSDRHAAARLIETINKE